MFFKQNAGLIAVGLVLTASLSLNVFQYVAAARAEPPPSALEAIEGVAFPEVDAIGLDGRKEAPIMLHDPTILYVFSPRCSFCERDYENLKAIANSTRGRFEIVGIVMHNERAPADYTKAISDYLARKPFPGRVLLLDPDGLEPGMRQRFLFTPQTLVIEGGVVRKAWGTALTDRAKRDAEAFFGFQLPGLEPM